ncbi:cobyric acid synthase [uncultured Clostridium sp.]|uniref:cobyric acid synthase n=1 Tax=uncultured Clostridium sp. TaxID=59620 RepID=UPI00262977C5|nr:cobyric acid synthase [uncultured Clostridium sp.]
MKKRIMILGTSSSVGKSTIATAFCKYFKDKGIDVAPYKALNISLNSYITEDGDEIGRSQTVQAEACNVEPKEYMNPILMKPGGGKTQVIARGRVLCSVNAYKYKELNNILKEKAYEAFLVAEEKHQMLVLEGSGGCAELNLRETDIANMHTALKTNTPVILVADIEKGGVFASVIGTLSIISEEERKLIKGIIINKFRGNSEFFNEGKKIIEEKTGVKVLGVMPYTKLNIEEEDSQTENINREKGEGIDIAVIKLPHMSNFTDLNYISTIEEVSVRYIETPKEIEKANVIVIPGSKNTIEDLRTLKRRGFKEALENFKEEDKKIIGICGGFQMMGKSLHDPLEIEGKIKEEAGLHFFEMETYFEEEKITKRINVKTDIGIPVEGYEIHNGRSYSKETPWIQDGDRIVGLKKDNICGTYLHGILDNGDIIKELLNIYPEVSYKDLKEKEYKKLKKTLEENIDMEYVEKIIQEWN